MPYTLVRGCYHIVHMTSHGAGMYGNEDGSIPATFEILNMIGWKPHSSQVNICIIKIPSFG